MIALKLSCCPQGLYSDNLNQQYAIWRHSHGYGPLNHLQQPSLFPACMQVQVSFQKDWPLNFNCVLYGYNFGACMYHTFLHWHLHAQCPAYNYNVGVECWWALSTLIIIMCNFLFWCSFIHWMFTLAILWQKDMHTLIVFLVPKFAVMSLLYLDPWPQLQ